MKTITLDNLDSFSVDFDNSPFNCWFKDKDESEIQPEHKDQISILDKNAANYLWDFEMKVNDRPLRDYPNLNKYFKSVDIYEQTKEKELKKWLYETGVPFKQKVYMSVQPDTGFVLTWKMVIKYSDNIFFSHDLAIWDKTLNWMLVFHHDGKWHFAKNRIEKN